jgi:putative transposase
MLKSIKVKLYPNEDQVTYMNKLLGTSRFVYNKCLNYKINEYKSNKKSTSFGETGKFLISLKLEFEWIKESHSKVLQQQLINLDRAYKNFFKQGNGFPKFKSRHENQSCRFPVDAISSIKGNRINIIKALNDIHYKCSKADESYLNHNQSDIKSATLTKNNCGDYYFSILIDRPNKTLNKSKNDLIGLDLGIKDFIITSEGQHYENLKSKRNNQIKLARQHRDLSSKQKGSNHQKQARIRLSKTYNKLNNIKEYYLHSITNQLLSENQTIVVEDLNVKGMLKNHQLARSIQELSLNRFKNMLMYKAEWYGREIIQVSRWFPSSKLCSCCGYKKDDLTLKDRFWVCPECNSSHNRDINAAINIKNEGERIKIGLSSPELTHQESNALAPHRVMKENVKVLSFTEL